MADRVLVTGISGFLGGHVALELLKAGYAVRGSVRDPARAQGVQTALAAAGADLAALDFVTLDLLDDTGWRVAIEGCRYLQHVASPLFVRPPRNPDEIIRPAVEGTRRAISAALEAGVERIVLTSSAAAVQYGHPAGRAGPFTDADWSTPGGEGVTAYSESKTRAELEAWSLVETAGRRRDLATINPAVVLGPLLDEDPGTSGQLIVRLLDGSAPAAPRVSFGIVDVRDVATLHRLAMENPLAGGHRYLASAATMSLMDLANALRPAFPDYAGRLPRFELPDWMVRLYAWFDPDLRGKTGSLGVVHELDCAPALMLLGRPFIPPRVAAAATARSLIDRGLLGRQKKR